MKKTLHTLLLVASFSTLCHADLLRVEASLGGWNAQPNGSIEGQDYGFKGVDTADEQRDVHFYGSLLIKHFIPVVPNLRVEYLDMQSTGTAKGTLSNTPIGADLASTSISMTQTDIIPYYNLVDNTFWTTIDLGVDFKLVDVEYDVDARAQFLDYSTSESLVLPLIYARGRVEIPGTEIGFEADLKYVEYDQNLVYDIRAKIDYTFDLLIGVQPGIEVGYRIQKYQSDETQDINLDLEYSGIYAGAMLKF